MATRKLKTTNGELVDLMNGLFSVQDLKGKGFAYLRTIIQNRNKNIGALKKNERAMLGSTPPVIEHEKEK